MTWYLYLVWVVAAGLLGFLVAADLSLAPYATLLVFTTDLLLFLVPSQTRVASGCSVDNAATCAGVR